MRYWNKILGCWWEPAEALQIKDGKIFQCYRIDVNGEHWIDVTPYIEVRNAS